MHSPTLHRPVRAIDLLEPADESPPDDLSIWSGRVSELSEAGSNGAVTWMAGLAAQVQRSGEQMAWVAAPDSLFFPPDLAYRGLDLAGITVVDVPVSGALQAAEWLLRSGAFGLLVVDWPREFVADSALGRLVRLAAEARTALVFLTRKSPDAPSLGSQIGLRAAVKVGEAGSDIVVLKNRGGVLSRVRWSPHGPMGLY